MGVVGRLMFVGTAPGTARMAMLSAESGEIGIPPGITVDSFGDAGMAVELNVLTAHPSSVLLWLIKTPEAVTIKGTRKTRRPDNVT
jgi:hypothetical protein